MTPREQLTALYTVLVREMLRFLRIWVQTVLPPAITTTLYFVIFGSVIGSQLREVHGFPYMDYIVPGIILMSVINNSYANVVSSFYGAKFQHHVEEMLVSPMPNYLILLGFVGGGMARGLIVGTVVSTIAFFFSNAPLHSLAIAIGVLVLTSLLFALAGFINAIYANSFDDISIVPTFVLTPLTYLGGVFFSVQALPGIWQNLAMFNPILYMVNAFRFGILGVSDISVAVAFGIIGLFIVVLFTFALSLLNRGVGLRG